MKTIITCLLVAASLAGAGIIASADTAAPSNEMATLVCRPAASDEKTMAQTTDNQALVCKPFDPKPLMAAKGPMSSIPNGTAMWQQMYNGIILGKYAL